jgi:hypothetical protein
MLYFLILIVDACKINCGAQQHSAFFSANWRNNPGDFYRELPEGDLCEVMPTRALYSWRIDHIIEITNDYPSISHCRRDIRGNLAEANSTWSREVGNLCCEFTDREKRIVYDEKYKAALDSVINCCDKKIDHSFFAICLAAIIVGGFFATCVTICWCTRSPESFDVQ